MTVMSGSMWSAGVRRVDSGGATGAHRGRGAREDRRTPFERSAERSNRRDGHRTKTVSTASGHGEVTVPTLRSGTFFPSLLGPPGPRSHASVRSDEEVAVLRVRVRNTACAQPYRVVYVTVGVRPERNRLNFGCAVLAVWLILEPHRLKSVNREKGTREWTASTRPPRHRQR